MNTKLIVTLSVFAALALAEDALKDREEFCRIPIGTKNVFLRWPLIFDKNGKLHTVIKDEITNENVILVKKGDQVTFSCGPNYFKHHYRLEVLSAVCDGASGHFDVDGTLKEASALTCDLRVIEEVLDDVYGCVGSKLTGSRFGYVDPNKNQTILIGEACYDTTAGQTRYVHFKLGDEGSTFIDMLPKNYLTSRLHPDGRYKIEIFRGLQFDEIYERIRSRTQTRHAPELKISKFVDEPLLSNAQYQAAEKLGWNYYVGYDENETLETLKKDIKRFCLSSNCDLYAGSHGIKQFNGNNGGTMEVFLHDATKRFPMPRLLWFVVKQTDKVIAFAVANDSIKQSNDISDNIENICKESVCETVTWLSKELQQDKRLICCNINDLRHTVKEVPVFSNEKILLI